MICCLVFFKQKPAYEMRISDWSSDVCSSDLACPEGRDAVMGEAAAATPYGDVAALQPNSPRSVAAGGAAEQEDRRQAERDRDDGRLEVALVAVLMQRKTRPGYVTVDQAGVGHEAGKSGFSRGAPRPRGENGQIGCGSCRDRVCQSVYDSGMGAK